MNPGLSAAVGQLSGLRAVWLVRSLRSIYNFCMKSFSRGLMIDVRRLQVLRELRMRSTIGATAQALNLTPSAVSQQIASLSRDIGVALLTPHGRGVNR